MRLFVALEIPSAVRQNLATLLNSFRSVTREPRWVRAENLHVTLKFLGEVAEGKLDAVRSALAKPILGRWAAMGPWTRWGSPTPFTPYRIAGARSAF